MSGKIIFLEQSLELESIRGGKQFCWNSAPFRSFLFKIDQNSAAELPSRSTFYSDLFDLCGRKIGQFATLQFLSSHRYRFLSFRPSGFSSFQILTLSYLFQDDHTSLLSPWYQVKPSVYQIHQIFSSVSRRTVLRNLMIVMVCRVLRNLVIVMVCAGHVCERLRGATVFSTVRMTKKDAPICQVFKCSAAWDDFFTILSSFLIL